MKSSKSVAHELVKLASDQQESLTPMQLLKLVYIAHGWMLGLYKRPLIKDEIQAWQYGPVIPVLYNRIRNFKSGPVTSLDPAPGETLDPVELNIVSQVYQKYGHMSGPALSRLTHASGTPWELIYEPKSFGYVIPNDLIEDHYASLAA